MKSLERDTRLILSHNPTGELFRLMGNKVLLLWRFNSIKRKQKATRKFVF